MPPLATRLRSAGTITAIASLTALTLLLPSAATAEPIGTAQQVSNYTPAISFTNCGSTALAYNAASGVTMAAWADPQGQASAALAVAVVGAGGTVGAASTFQPSAATPLANPSACNPVSIDAAANGGFLLTWSNGASDSTIYGMFVSSAGAFAGSVFTVSSNTNYSDIETVSSAWSQADSRYLVTWKANANGPFPGTGQQLVGRFLDAAGTPVGADFLATTAATVVDDSQDLAYGGGIWLQVGGAVADDRIYAVAIQPDGTVSPAAELFVAANPTGPSVAFNATTNQFLVVARSGPNVVGQFVSTSGALVGSPFSIATGNTRPRVASLGADGWVVTWHTVGGADVVAIEVSTAGVPIGTPETISGVGSSVVESNFRPEVEFSPTTGEAYMLWTRHDAATATSNVFVRAWAVTASAVAPAAGPTLPAAGPETERIVLLTGAAVVTLAAGALLLSRRRTPVVS